MSLIKAFVAAGWIWALTFAAVSAAEIKGSVISLQGLTQSSKVFLEAEGFAVHGINCPPADALKCLAPTIAKLDRSKPV